MMWVVWDLVASGYSLNPVSQTSTGFSCKCFSPTGGLGYAACMEGGFVLSVACKWLLATLRVLSNTLQAEGKLQLLCMVLLVAC
jgi:hypothetical protein